jgi:hypothetical protein
MKKITLLKSGFRLFVVALTLCSTVFLQSCKDAMLEPEKVETNKIDPLQEGSVVSKDNRLVFSSDKFLDKYLSDLKKSQPDGMNPSYNVNIKGFKSMQEKYDELMKYGLEEAIKDGTIENYKDVLEITTDEKGRKEFNIAVGNHLLASIISEKGLYQMGNDVYKIKDGKAYKTTEDNIQELSSVGIKESSRVSVVEFRVPSKSNKSAKVNGYVDEQQSPNVYTAFPGASARRFCTRIIIERVNNTSYAQFSVTHQRDNWYGWGELPTGPWISYNAGGTYSFSYGVSGNFTPLIVNNYPSSAKIWHDMEVTSIYPPWYASRVITISGTWKANGNDDKPYQDTFAKTAYD